ncbi:MAG TPA: V-type ATP synthase subunit D [Planctomycetaceae bacterium]|nr:V-type ATP synthase subunit D [Planctomycetaceae bacterium]
MTIALNKTTLKQQRDQAKTFKQFLPSLDLKRQQLLIALKSARQRLDDLDAEMNDLLVRLEPLYPLLGSSTIPTLKISGLIAVRGVRIETENVVGTYLPVVREVDFGVNDYSTMATPFWVDHLVQALQQMSRLRIEHQVGVRRFELLELAARRITQRVNLFEKVLIPQAEQNIRRIVIFLSDQERAAVVRSKISKGKQASDS